VVTDLDATELAGVAIGFLPLSMSCSIGCLRQGRQVTPACAGSVNPLFLQRKTCPGQWLPVAQIDSRKRLQQDARPVLVTLL
jgi:hypothetical protein